ncbi:MAG: amidohydrolase family protein [Nannocystaceae bacterium]
MAELSRRRLCLGLGAALLAGCRKGQVDAEAPGLLIRGAQVYTEGGLREVDVRAVGGVIAALGAGLEARSGDEVIEARGLLALPGGIDPHVHLSAAAAPPADKDDFCDNYADGSRAALAGGVTTIGAMVFPGATARPIVDAVDRHSESARAQASVDVMLHPVVFEPGPDAVAALAELRARGHTSVKVFVVMAEFEARRAGFVELIREAGRRRMLPLLHCESHAINEAEIDRLMAAGRGSLRNYAESSPVASEVAAVREAIAIATTTGSPIYVVHLSSAQALDACRAARRRGVPIYVETRPMYLHHTRAAYARADGPLYVGQPPLREEADVAALWDGLARGRVDTIGSDHAPFRMADKLNPAATVREYKPGTPSLQMMLPMLFSEGVRRGRLGLDRFVAATSTNAARLFGLYPRKGALRVGADADITLWDPARRRRIEAAQLQSRAGYDINLGREVEGWPVYTVRRGEIAFADEQILAAPGSGELLVRGPHQPLA